MRLVLAGILMALVTVASAAADADEPCRLEMDASLDMGTDANGGSYVSISVGGHDENMLVDTGGIYSMLTASTVDDLQLRREAINTSRLKLTMYGGAVIHEYVTAHDVKLENMKADRMEFIVAPGDIGPPEIAGTISPDILRGYDVDFDFAKGKFNLFSRDHCEGEVVYWTKQNYAKVPMQVDDWGHMTLPVVLDGKEVQASLDTGSSRSILKLESARSIFGWDEKTANLKPAQDWPGAYHFPFRTLSLANEVSVFNPDIVIDSVEHSKVRSGPALIIGMGVLRRLHLYIAYKERNIYATTAEAR